MIPEEQLAFLDAVWSRRTPFTLIFLAMNIAVFGLMTFEGGTTNPDTLIAFGVKSNPHIKDGEIWRLITPIFIHIGVLHLFFNSYALWIVGAQVEKLYGSARFVVLYVLTGVAGVLGSYLYHPEIMSAGASGAIFGLFGVLLVFGVRYRHSIPPFFKRAVGTGVVPVIVINFVIGLTIPGIDNSAHLSGFIAGAGLATAIPYLRPGGQTHSSFAAAQIVLLLIIAASFYKVAANYHGSPQGFIDAINSAQQAFEASPRGRDPDRVAGSIDKLRSAPSLDPRADELTAELLRLMEDHFELLQDIERSGATTFAQARRLKENEARYAEIMESIFEWVNSDGKRFGIQMGNRR